MRSTLPAFFKKDYNMDIVSVGNYMPRWTIEGFFRGLTPSAQWIAIDAYRNSVGEISDYTVLLHVDYLRMVRMSAMMLDHLHTEYAESCQQVWESLQRTIDGKQIPRQGFIELCKGCKLHTDSDTIHIWGYVPRGERGKRIIVPGVYPIKAEKPETVARRRVESLLPVSRFRQFALRLGKERNWERVAAGRRRLV